METNILINPANSTILGIPGVLLWWVIPALGSTLFGYIMIRRLVPLALSSPDPRLNNLVERVGHVLKFAIGQWRQPRYMLAGVLHIMIFAGFCVLSVRSITLVM